MNMNKKILSFNLKFKFKIILRKILLKIKIQNKNYKIYTNENFKIGYTIKIHNKKFNKNPIKNCHLNNFNNKKRKKKKKSKNKNKKKQNF